MVLKVEVPKYWIYWTLFVYTGQSLSNCKIEKTVDIKLMVKYNNIYTVHNNFEKFCPIQVFFKSKYFDKFIVFNDISTIKTIAI